MTDQQIKDDDRDVVEGQDMELSARRSEGVSEEPMTDVLESSTPGTPENSKEREPPWRKKWSI